VAKAADCKSAIVGSTPTGASFSFLQKCVFPVGSSTRGGEMVASHSGDSKVTKRTVMIVEAAGKSQESLQKFFMDRGYRAFITQDPERALMRFKTWPRPDLLLVSAQIMQEPVMKLFNSFSKDRYLARVPVLMIGSRQRKQFFIDEAKTDELRKVLLIPFKADTLLSLVESLIEQSKSDE
jgi:DNA-binding NtrC family response regulator